MARNSKDRVLIAGILSPFAAAVVGAFVYLTLTRISADVSRDFVFRLTAVTVAMTAPFWLTFFLALSDRRRHAFSVSGRVGMSIALLSLGLTSMPLKGLVGRMRQAQNLSLRDIAAPPFDTVDIFGKPHRLKEHLGKVVLINAWATWCPPCKKEMPELDNLYQQHKEDGFIVFGLSTEDAELQRKFVTEALSVTYPLLTVNGTVPSLYRDIERWPGDISCRSAGQPATGP